MDVRRALSDIASGSPAQHYGQDGSWHVCSQCAAYIALAREAIGAPALPEPHSKYLTPLPIAEQ